MYFSIYVHCSQGDVYLQTIKFIDLSYSIDLYELKQEIVRIEEQFEAWKLTQPNVDGQYELLISTTNPNTRDITD